jgi:hypothetical protein
MSWNRLLESIAQAANDHLRLRNEYLAAENRSMRNQIGDRVQLTDSERKELAELGAQLGKKALSEIATVAQPDAILAWKRKFADQPANTVEPSKSVGRPRVDKEIEDWEQTGTEVVFAEAQLTRLPESGGGYHQNDPDGGHLRFEDDLLPWACPA